MLTSRGPRRVESVAVYTLGLVLGALVTGAVLWIASGFGGALPDGVAAAVVLALAGVGVARDLGLVSFPLPENRRLVPQEVFHRGRRLGALQFGFEMGTGVRTYVPSTSPYVLALAVVVIAPGLLGGVLPAALGFALGRAAVPWSRVFARREEAWDRRLDATAAVGVRASGACMLALMVGMLPLM